MPGKPDAGRRWAIYRDSHLSSWGWTRLSFESGHFYRSTSAGQPVWLLADNDDFLILGPDHSTLDHLRRPFNAAWQVSQLLLEHGADSAHPLITPWPQNTDLSALRPGERGVNSTKYASIVDAVRFLADTSHPLLSFAVQRLATALHNPWKRHLNAPTPSSRTFASSRRQASVVGSTTEAEPTAAATASRDIRWLANLAQEVGVSLSNPRIRAADGTTTSVVTICIDNKGAIDIAAGAGPTKGSRHMAVCSMLVQEQVARRHLRIRQVTTQDQLADAMTKALGLTKYSKVRAALGLTLASSPSQVAGRKTALREQFRPATMSLHAR
eukprot:IDg3993t1